MGLLNSALQIGRSALLSYQGALQVVGNNISSVGSPDYTRLSPQLDPLQGNSLTRGLQPGAGVALSSIQRNLDEALESRLRLAINGRESLTMQQSTLGQIETLFDDLNGNGLASTLRQLFDSFDELQNAPEDGAIRDLVLARASQTASTLNDVRSRLIELGESTDAQIPPLVETANSIATEIAELNTRIVRAEAGGTRNGTGLATGLRDQRDGLLRTLSETFDVSVREQPNGAINVYIGSEALIQGGSVRNLASAGDVDGEFTRTSVRFADTNAQVPATGGQLLGIVESRDQHAYGRVAAVDELAAAIIADVNRVHANGQGKVGFRSVVGTYDLLSTDSPLNSSAAGLAFPPSSGSLYVTVSDDATSTPQSYRIEMTLDSLTDDAGLSTDTTLDSFVEDFNGQVEGVTVSITPDRRLQMVADDGLSFTFGHDGQQARADTSGFLAAMGLNTLFTGNSAKNIAVNEELVREPGLIAAATVALVGDGTNAVRLAQLDTQPSNRLGGNSLTDGYTALAGNVAVTTAAVRDASEAAGTVALSLQSQKESVSGVNLDEEAVSLLKYERAFQGTSRYISVVDGLLTELISLIR